MRHVLRVGLAAVALVLVAVGLAPAAIAASPSSSSPETSPASTPTSSPTSSQATDIASVAAALQTDPLYVSTAPGTAAVAAGDVRGTLPPNVYVAVLPAAAAAQVRGEPAAVPGAILGRLGRPGSVLALVGRTLEAASRTEPADQVQEALGDGRQQLATGGSTAAALSVAAHDLSGSGQLSDAPSAARAGSPSGSGFLWVVLGTGALAVLSIPVLLRRARRRPPVRPQALRDRVEIDAYGRVVRRIPAAERAHDQHEPHGS